MQTLITETQPLLLGIFHFHLCNKRWCGLSVQRTCRVATLVVFSSKFGFDGTCLVWGVLNTWTVGYGLIFRALGNGIDRFVAGMSLIFWLSADSISVFNLQMCLLTSALSALIATFHSPASSRRSLLRSSIGVTQYSNVIHSIKFIFR